MTRPPEQTIALVTGATDGLGRSLARELASRGATVLVHGRDRDRGERTVAELREQTANERIELRLAELSELAQVTALAEDVAGSVPELHLLVNNAGIGSGLPDSRQRQRSADGIELRFAVNYLAGFALTERLLEPLARSAPARIVNVASLGQAPLDFDDPLTERDYDGSLAYARSKLAQILYTFELAERLPDGVTATCLHPGTYMPTKIVVEELGRSVDSLETGTNSTLRLALDPELEGVSGRFFDRESEAEPDPQAADPEARRRLRELSLELVRRARAGTSG